MRRIEFADNLTKIHNGLLWHVNQHRCTNIEVKPAAAGGRVEITGDLAHPTHLTSLMPLPTFAAAAAGVINGQVYRNGSQPDGVAVGGIYKNIPTVLSIGVLNLIKF